jgi:hypothetical protein
VLTLLVRTKLASLKATLHAVKNLPSNMTEVLGQWKVKLYAVCIDHTTFFYQLNMSKELNKSEDLTGPNQP